MISRDFKQECLTLFQREREGPRIPVKLTEVFIPVKAHRFNVIKETERGSKVIEFGITLEDALRGVDGRFRNTDATRFRIIPAEATWVL